MKNQIEIVKDVADGMIGIGGVPSNEEFYNEFEMRVKAALNLPVVNTSTLTDYDSGLINDYGGGDKGWWMDCIRAEVDAANEHWKQQLNIDE